MKEPLISVIIPVYNVERYLEQCLRSVIGQTYKNLEIILIDDGSPDNCPQICDKYAKQDNRIKVIHKENAGLSSARNAGLSMATGEYISFVDSDDWLELETYENVISMFNSGEFDIVCFEGIKTDGEKKIDDCFVHYPIGTVLDGGTVAKQILLDKIGSQTVQGVYKSECWKGIEFPISRIYEDIPTTYKAFLRAEKIGFIAKPFYNYRISGKSISFDDSNLRPYHIFLGFKEHFDFAENNFPEIANECCLLAAHYAISTFFNYYSVYQDIVDIDLSVAKVFLIKNKATIKKYKRLIPHTRALALDVYYFSPTLFKFFCNRFGRILIKLRKSN